MKSYLTIVLAVVSGVLAVVLFTTKHADNAQMTADAAAIVDYSNRLDTAQAQIVVRDGSLLTWSNRLDECQAASGALSNRLTEAQSTLALDAEQLTVLNRLVTTAAAENQGLNRRAMELTNQVAGLSSQLAQTQADLARTNLDLVQLRKDYSLLENRFRRDVAERVVVERRFNTYSEVQAQAKKLWSHSEPWATPESIYKSLDVEVKSNGEFHVIAPN
jgi:chromosome segregation ATPase